MTSRSAEGKVALVTGASSGIGAHVARRLAADGARVVVAARRRDRLDALVDEIEREGGEAVAVEADVRDRHQVQAAVDTAVSRYGRLDVLCNNAGIMPVSRLSLLELDHWEDMVDVNVKGVLWGVAAALPVMRQQGSGHVVNIASVGARAVAPGGAVYSATKFAVRALSEGLRLEEPDLRVTVVYPGATSTELGHDITDPSTAAAASSAQGRSLDPATIAEAVAFAVAQPAHVDVSELVVRPLGGW